MSNEKQRKIIELSEQTKFILEVDALRKKVRLKEYIETLCDEKAKALRGEIKLKL